MPDFVMSGPECRALDRRAMQELGLSEFQLMQRAGRAAMEFLQASWPGLGRLAVYCGPGNNGGDGYLLAAQARRQSYAVQVFALGEPGSETARTARQCALDEGVEITPVGARLEDNLDPDAELIVDALFGHGLTREIGEPLAALFAYINAASLPVYALDVPSGIDSDTGAVMGIALRAHATLSFVAPKIGLMTGPGLDYAGRTAVHGLGIPDRLANDVNASYRRLTRRQVSQALSPPARTRHKGDFGHVAVIGGQAGMPGAVILAASAAIRAGAGRVTAITNENHASLIPLASPVLMTAGIDVDGGFQWPESTSAIVLGPGLGAAAGWSRSVYRNAIDAATETGLPLVVDADGLNLLAHDDHRCGNWVLTPHPGEAAKLLDCGVTEIQADRPSACRRIAERYGGVCVLKGAGSLVGTADGPIAVCDRGNWGMATAGSGDVLSGIIGAYLALGFAPRLAAEVGVYVHAWLGDLAAQRLSRRGMVASDLVDTLPELYLQLEAEWK